MDNLHCGFRNLLLVRRIFGRGNGGAWDPEPPLGKFSFPHSVLCRNTVLAGVVIGEYYRKAERGVHETVVIKILGHVAQRIKQMGACVPSVFFIAITERRESDAITKGMER